MDAYFFAKLIELDSLHFAATRGFFECIEELIQAGSIVDAKNVRISMKMKCEISERSREIGCVCIKESN